MPNQPLKNPGIAAVLSALWSGFGQIYNGQIGKGILFIIIQAINGLLFFVLIGFITWPIMWIWGVVDAYRSAERYNRMYSDH
ncbi:BH0908 [Halalkalibacterium halodurans C-125]|uniref:BH0908 protein n=1 Tax=Halalkalibacterium halodurans (strain ATCC BAA-125 / DSM 18197 / FERM 7344 / JCM 9153 / C-125) TaxID=272558 RepID=Q9KEE4_HALH5|nr:BH0908 [Halalkalibacterium halodurans C-125]